MRVLADLTSFTTAELTITEIHNYKPEDAPTLATRVGRSFDSLLVALASTGANAPVAAAAVVPWHPTFAVRLSLPKMFLRIKADRSAEAAR